LDALADRLGAQKRYTLIEKQKRGGVWWVRVFLYKRERFKEGSGAKCMR
jgi:hypothetical protein